MTATMVDPETAQRTVLDVADRLFYERGIAAVGMADIRDESGLSLRRVYTMFPSKSDLVAAWLEDRNVRWMRWFTTTAERLARDGADPVVATFYALAQWASSPGYRGCSFINALAETGEIDERHREIVTRHKRDLLDHLTALATSRHPGAPVWLAQSIAVLIDGAIVQSAALGSTAPIVAARQAAIALLASLGD